jgi:hypothetical protein
MVVNVVVTVNICMWHCSLVSEPAPYARSQLLRLGAELLRASFSVKLL